MRTEVMKHIGLHVESTGAVFKLARIGCRITLLLLTVLIKFMRLTLHAGMSVPVEAAGGQKVVAGGRSCDMHGTPVGGHWAHRGGVGMV